MRIIVIDDNGEEMFSYASPESNPGQLNTMCALDQKARVITCLAESIMTLCDTQFPITEAAA